jgi:hypothetical protein
MTKETRLHPSHWAIQYGLPPRHTEDMTRNEQAGQMTLLSRGGRQLATTESSCFGLVLEAMVGDFLCVLMGTGVPFLLKKIDEG